MVKPLYIRLPDLVMWIALRFCLLSVPNLSELYILFICVSAKNFAGKTPTELAASAGHFEVSSVINEFKSLSRLSSVNGAANGMELNKPSPGKMCKRQSLPALDDLLDKRRKFTGKSNVSFSWNNWITYGIFFALFLTGFCSRIDINIEE